MSSYSRSDLEVNYPHMLWIELTCSLGLYGIQPPDRPREYDHSAARSFFHVQNTHPSPTFS
jgi:hypothetical protein